jgi:hypothetical protein
VSTPGAGSTATSVDDHGGDRSGSGSGKGGRGRGGRDDGPGHD